MQLVSRQGHIPHRTRFIQPGQDPCDFLTMSRRHLSPIIVLKQLAQALVLKIPYHCSILER
jgi:hypothetical protein